MVGLDLWEQPLTPGTVSTEVNCRTPSWCHGIGVTHPMLEVLAAIELEKKLFFSSGQGYAKHFVSIIYCTFFNTCD